MSRVQPAPMVDKSFRTAVLLLSAMFALAVGSCTSESESMGKAGAQRPMRKVHSTELLSAMRDIDGQTRSQFAAEIYTGSPNRDDLRAMGQAAAAVAKLAPRIPSMVAPTEMSEQDRTGFTALAGQLGDEALQLQKAADAYDIQMVRIHKKQLNKTCNQCHSQYRGT